MDLGLEGDSAIVTASTSGLGKAAATGLAREGVDVVINSRYDDHVEEAVADIREVATGRVVGQPGDLRNYDDIKKIVRTAEDEFDGLDHLVTNSGGPPGRTVMESTNEEWYDAFDLLVMSVVRLVWESADLLRADGGGTLVTLTSRAVKRPFPKNVLSNSVRMAVIGLEKTLSYELAPEVRSLAVLQGEHETPRLRELIERAVERGDYDSYEEYDQALLDEIPLGRRGDLDDFGGIVAFLCSHYADFIHGTTLTVDGGSIRASL